MKSLCMLPINHCQTPAPGPRPPLSEWVTHASGGVPQYDVEYVCGTLCGSCLASTACRGVRLRLRFLVLCACVRRVHVLVKVMVRVWMQVMVRGAVRVVNSGLIDGWWVAGCCWLCA